MAAVAAFRDEDTACCRSCHTAAMRVDWAQGDRICTYCGVVDDERLLDDRPEWRDYNDAEDMGKEKARSGLVLVDESRYFGGLQPTGLSSYIHGAAYKTSVSTRKTLVRVNRKMDRTMEKIHGKSVEGARLVRALAAKGRDGRDLLESSDHENPLEIEQLLVQEEEDANRLQQALNANKWSLSRAVRLYGSSYEQTEANAHDHDVDDEALDAKLDTKLRQCARDLYQAYAMLTSAGNRLRFTDRVINEAASLLCDYASRRDGLVVRGVASTLQRKPSTGQVKQCNKQHERAASALREYNKLKQSGALVTAILLYTGRRHGHERSMQEICATVDPPALDASTLDTSGEFIKKKHCYRAMKELETFFPKVVVQSNSATATKAPGSLTDLSNDDPASISNFVNHSVSQLDLPPVAEASVRILCHYWREKCGSDVSPPTICAAMVYLVCSVGTTMKRLASQATRSKKRKLSYNIKEFSMESGSKESGEVATDRETNADLTADDETETIREQRAYEMMRAWDAWQEQMPWAKSVSEIEQSCGISSSVFVEYYREYLYPCRVELLGILRVCAQVKSTGSIFLRETPLATVLLPQIAVAAPLLSDG